MPKKIPIIEIPVKMPKKAQSMVRFCTSPKKPISELTAIINKEVATASFIGKPASKTKAGIIKNPPPAPKIPVIIPINSP